MLLAANRKNHRMRPRTRHTRQRESPVTYFLQLGLPEISTISVRLPVWFILIFYLIVPKTVQKMSLWVYLGEIV